MIENALDPPPDPDDEFDTPYRIDESCGHGLRSEREQILERLLRNLLEEVGMRDGMGRFSEKFCMGCVKKNPKMLRACVAARKFLDG